MFMTGKHARCGPGETTCTLRLVLRCGKVHFGSQEGSNCNTTHLEQSSCKTSAGLFSLGGGARLVAEGAE